MNRILIEADGNASLTILGGGTVTSKEGVIGNSSTSVGTVTITGKDALGTALTWNIGGNLTIGSYGGNTQLTIVNGGRAILTFQGSLYVQALNGASSDVVVSVADSILSSLYVSSIPTTTPVAWLRCALKRELKLPLETNCLSPTLLVLRGRLRCQAKVHSF